MESNSLLSMIMLMAGVTYLARILHVFISLDRIPMWLRNNMHLIPVVIIAAIVSTSVFVQNGKIDLFGSLSYLAAMTVTVAVYFVFKSGGVAVIIGLATHIIIKVTGI